MRTTSEEHSTARPYIHPPPLAGFAAVRHDRIEIHLNKDLGSQCVALDYLSNTVSPLKNYLDHAQGQSCSIPILHIINAHSAFSSHIAAVPFFATSGDNNCQPCGNKCPSRDLTTGSHVRADTPET